MRKVVLVCITIILLLNQVVNTQASVSAIYTEEFRGIPVTSKFTMNQNEIVGKTETKYTGELILTFLANAFYSNFSININEVDLLLGNSDYTSVIASLWLTNDTDHFVYQNNHPQHIIKIPLEFTSRLIDHNFKVSISVTIRGTYTGYLLNSSEFVTIYGTIGILKYGSNIDYKSDDVISDSSVEVSTSTWIILGILVIVVFLLMYQLYKYNLKKISSSK